jgi:hypothetical protein
MRPTPGPVVLVAAAIEICLLSFPQTARAALPPPAGAWDFDNPQQLLHATIGPDLFLVGSHEAVSGPRAGDGAVRIGVGSYYVCDHGIPPSAPNALVNRFSLLLDIRIPAVGPWYCLFQTDPDNANDGDCFIHNSSGTLGVGATGYSTTPIAAATWQRVIIAADHIAGSYRIYLDGQRTLNGNPQPVDGRFALQPSLLLFADEDGEDAVLDVARVALYDVCLSDAQAAELGTVPTGNPANKPPTLAPGPAGPATPRTGQTVAYRFIATDPEASPLQVQVDWGDGGDLSPWSSLTPSGSAIEVTHTFRFPGTFTIRALPRDAAGATGAWTTIQSVAVSGVALVQFLTPPYQQNVKTDAITLLWEMDGAADAAVDYGPNAGYGSTITATRQGSGAGTFIYRASLVGLAPNAPYYFRCRAGAAEQTGSFKTAPVGPVDFCFAVWSDSQGSNHGAYAADPLEPTSSMMRHIAANGINLAVTTGDLAESGDSYADVRQFYLDRVATLLGPTVPWFVAWGNHDAGSDSIIRRFADLPSQERPGFTPGYGSYSFDYAGCHFVCLDYANAANDILDWLESDLQSPANLNARFTFLFVHAPPFCELWIDGNEFYRESLVPLLESYGVDVCFSGHTHEYSRGFLNGVHYCITGGGSWLDLPETLVYDWPHMNVGGCHPIPGVPQIDADHGGGLINEYVRVDVRESGFTASMIGFQPDGTPVGTLDQFSSSATPQGRPPATPQVSGPAQFDILTSTPLILHSSSFSDPDPQDAHVQSTWRLSSSTNLLDAASLLVESTTGARVVDWSVPLASLWPGQTVYAGVRHIASDGKTSAFSTALPIRLSPEPVFVENFDSVPELSLPTGWIAEHHTTINHNYLDPDDPLSNTYLTWTVVGFDRLARVFGPNRVNVPAVVHGQSVYAESDLRTGIQIQFLTSPDVDLNSVSNVVLMFRSNYLQNQDSLAALEFSTNSGLSWLPIAYLLDAPDVIARSDGSGIDATATFTRVDDSGVPTAGGRSASGGTYGEHIRVRPFANLADFISPRLNDDLVESKRSERYRLPQADRQPRVRFRFTLVGTASWFWGIDDFTLFGSALQSPPLQITRIHQAAAGSLNLEWTGPDGPYALQSCTNLNTDPWQNLNLPIDATQRSIQLPSPATNAFFRLRIAR